MQEETIVDQGEWNKKMARIEAILAKKKEAEEAAAACKAYMKDGVTGYIVVEDMPPSMGKKGQINRFYDDYSITHEEEDYMEALVALAKVREAYLKAFKKKGFNLKAADKWAELDHAFFEKVLSMAPTRLIYKEMSNRPIPDAGYGFASKPVINVHPNDKALTPEEMANEVLLRTRGDFGPGGILAII